MITLVCLDHRYDLMLEGWCFLVRQAMSCEL
jgi:hypothetical protein